LIHAAAKLIGQQPHTAAQLMSEIFNAHVKFIINALQSAETFATATSDAYDPWLPAAAGMIITCQFGST
jgi:hypothetical protein